MSPSRWLSLGAIAALSGACGGPEVVRAPAAAPRRASAPAYPATPASPLASPERERLQAAIRAAVEPRAAWQLVPVAGSEESYPPLPPLVRSHEEPVLGALGSEEPRLPPETVRRVVRQSSGRFLGCLRRGLRDDPRVKGRVVVRFTIGSDGLVSRAEEELATIADREARKCLLSSFFELRFPAPPQGGLRVRYPLAIGRGAERAPDELHEARRAAEPPPPGFAEAMRAGRRLEPVAPAPSIVPPAEPRPRSCGDGDPMCAEL